MTAPQSLPNLDWEPTSWHRYPAAQQPTWPDETALDAALAELRTKPPLVFAGEARSLRESLAAVSRGEGFLLHAGDCAESFAEFTADSIRDKLKVILQMSVVLTYSTGVPTLKVGRIAGQFAKPRSSPTETRTGVQLPPFSGHIVHDYRLDAVARRPDPQRVLPRSPHAPRQPHRRLVRLLGPPRLGWRAHPPDRRRARRVHVRRAESHRREARPDGDARGSGRAVPAPRPRARAGPARARQPHGCRAG